MNDAILQAAQNLGNLLRESEEFTAMQQKEVDALLDNDLQGLYREYALARQNLQEAQMQPQPDETAVDSLRSEVSRLEGELGEDRTLQALTASRNGFERLMQQVNGVLESILNPHDEEEEAFGGCGGSCAGCHGCGA